MGELGVWGVVGQGGKVSGLSNPPEPEPEPEPRPGADARGSYMRSSLKRVKSLNASKLLLSFCFVKYYVFPLPLTVVL
jgi:hypothetical protein